MTPVTKQTHYSLWAHTLSGGRETSELLANICAAGKHFRCTNDHFPRDEMTGLLRFLTAPDVVKSYRSVTVERPPTEMYRCSYSGVLITLEVFVLMRLISIKHSVICTARPFDGDSDLFLIRQNGEQTRQTLPPSVLIAPVSVSRVFVLRNELTYQHERRNRSNCRLDSSPVIP